MNDDHGEDELLTLEVVKRQLWHWANGLGVWGEAQLLRRAVTLLDEYELLLSHQPDRGPQ
jgi:hypothetical protein